MSRFELNEQSDRFEQRVVFRTSRSVHLALAVVVALAIAGCVLLVFYGVTPTFKGSAPDEPILVTPKSVTAEDVLAAMEDLPEVGEAEEYWEEPSLEDEIDPYAELISRIGEYFQQDSHPWDSRYKRYCASAGWYGDCYRYDTRLVARGAKDLLSETANNLPYPRAVAYLEGVLTMMRLNYDEEHRFLGIRALSDLSQTQAVNYTEAYQGIYVLYGGNTQPLVLLSEEAQTLVYNAILRMTKLGTSPARFLVWTPQTRRFSSLFMESEQLSGLVMFWNVLGDGDVEEITARADLLHPLVSAIPQEKRVRALQVWSRLTDERLAEVLHDYDLAMMEYRGDMSERENQYESKKTQKASLRTTGLYGVLAGIGAIAALGLLLALLAVERNTRALHTLAHAYAKDESTEETTPDSVFSSVDPDLAEMDSDVPDLEDDELELDEPV